MTRPHIIRADTIDLQDHNAPSAQDHTKQPTHPAALGAGPPAPHQAEMLRDVAAEVEEEQHRNPRVSTDWHDEVNGHGQQYGNNTLASNSLTDVNLQQQDALAIAQNGGLTGAEDAEMADAEGDDGLDDDMMDKISSSPSIDDEDIDFDLVYALHTFVATVEGQANATKGDTMVLLDDSNSYWWLVRVVKDSSIGYLPAEHIETPTERLARLNKHRNIDLSATMLGDKDQAEKSKNPLKKAIRRRNAKTVTFSSPTYVEASDNDYSTEEEEAEGDFYGQEQQQASSQQYEREDDEATLVEAPAANGGNRDLEMESPDNASRALDERGPKASSEITRTSDEIFDGKPEGIGKSRNGTVRNTDSFFKDDSVETRKITLTPNLLRDDSSTSTRTSNDSKETRQRPSLDKLEKDSVSERSKDDKKKKEKKEKDKKPGMLSNLFKRKDKKGKAQDDDIDDFIYGKKASSEDTRTSPVPSKESEDFATEEQASHLQLSPHRHPSKLQKQPRTELSTTKQQQTSASDAEPQPPAAPNRAPPTLSLDEPSMRLVQSESQYQSNSSQNSRGLSTELTRASSALQNEIDDQESRGTFSKILRSRSAGNSEPRVEMVKKARVRAELDDFESSTDTSPIDEGAKEPATPVAQRPSIPGTYPDSYNATLADGKLDLMNERLSESPIQISPVEGSRSNPPALMVDTSSQEEAGSPTSSPSPELVDVNEIHGKKSSENSISTPTSISTWSDAHLRTYFDDDTDIKDLLVVVYDKSGVVPAGPDHPIMGNLFKEENAKLADITNRLDSMLGDWLVRKMKISPSR